RDVVCLTSHVLGAHVDLAGQTEQRAGGGGGHTVLTGAGLGDHPSLPHTLGQQHLAQGVVHLVGTRVAEVLALEPDVGPRSFGPTRGAAEWCGSPHVITQELVKSGTEARVASGLCVGLRELFEGGDQGLGHEAPTIGTEPSVARCLAHAESSLDRTACTNASSSRGSLMPGADSTPLATSTPNGCTNPTASPTLRGLSPPAKNTERARATGKARDQSN